MLRAIKGDFIYAGDRQKLSAHKNSYLVYEDGVIHGIYSVLPAAYLQAELEDYEGRLIIPGLNDLHLHAPQYSFRGLGMDMELLDWLQTQAFPNEARYADIAYADRAYSQFVEALRTSATCRAAIFATLHTDATLLLMQKLEESGLYSFVGRVNMDREAPVYLCEASAAAALEETRSWIEHSLQRFHHTRPILTPRFIPSCTDTLMRGIGRLAERYAMPLQSHLSENPAEIALVGRLCPDSGSYAEAYARRGCLGQTNAPAIMAHCVWCDEDEQALLREYGAFVAHCPDSNMNLSSGIAPVRQYMDAGLRLGLGSDVAGGTQLSLFRAMQQAVQCSKLRWRLNAQTEKPLSLAEVFYMATRGGGEFFGAVGAFEPGYAADLLVLDEGEIPTPLEDELSLQQRLERYIYLAAEQRPLHKYVAGNKLF